MRGWIARGTGAVIAYIVRVLSVLVRCPPFGGATCGAFKVGIKSPCCLGY